MSAASPRVPALRIEASGMCCAVGHNAPAAAAAMGACVDHFRQSWFRTRGGSALTCATVWGLESWGPQRMGALFHSVLAECRQQTTIIPEETALVLLVADPARPGAMPGFEEDWAQEVYEHCVGELRFHAASRICPWDRAGVGPGLLHARELLASGAGGAGHAGRPVRKVLLAGVDSYLNAVTINAFLEEELLLTGEVTDGFIPGEGAGAVVLTLAKSGEGGVCVAGVGVGMEEGCLRRPHDASGLHIPNRGTGLVAAVRAAVAESGRPLTQIDFHMADNNGLDVYARERALMLVRCLEHRVMTFPLVLPAAYVGETGAAVGPLMLAYLPYYMQRCEYGYGLVQCSSDSGQRAALLVTRS